MVEGEFILSRGPTLEATGRILGIYNLGKRINRRTNLQVVEGSPYSETPTSGHALGSSPLSGSSLESAWAAGRKTQPPVGTENHHRFGYRRS